MMRKRSRLRTFLGLIFWGRRRGIWGSLVDAEFSDGDSGVEVNSVCRMKSYRADFS